MVLDSAASTPALPLVVLQFPCDVETYLRQRRHILSERLEFSVTNAVHEQINVTTIASDDRSHHIATLKDKLGKR